MEKKVAAFDARRQFGKVLNEVAAHGDRYVVERHGEPVAAIVPIEVYEQWKRARQAFFDQMREVSARANMDPEEGAALVAEAVAAVRAVEYAHRR